MKYQSQLLPYEVMFAEILLSDKNEEINRTENKKMTKKKNMCPLRI